MLHTRKRPAVTEAGQSAMEGPRTAADEALADKLAKRSPPHPVERAQIEKARKRTKARTPRIAMHIKDRGTGVPTLYPDHSDEEGHQYRLADAFGTRSLQFVYSMLKGLGHATADHSLNLDFSPASPMGCGRRSRAFAAGAISFRQGRERRVEFRAEAELRCNPPKIDDLAPNRQRLLVLT